MFTSLHRDKNRIELYTGEVAAPIFTVRSSASIISLLIRTLTLNSSLDMWKPYLDAMERLIRQGIYVSRAEVIKDALRRLFRHYGIEILEE